MEYDGDLPMKYKTVDYWDFEALRPWTLHAYKIAADGEAIRIEAIEVSQKEKFIRIVYWHRMPVVWVHEELGKLEKDMEVAALAGDP